MNIYITGYPSRLHSWMLDLHPKFQSKYHHKTMLIITCMYKIMCLCVCVWDRKKKINCTVRHNVKTKIPNWTPKSNLYKPHISRTLNWKKILQRREKSNLPQTNQCLSSQIKKKKSWNTKKWEHTRYWHGYI